MNIKYVFREVTVSLYIVAGRNGSKREITKN
jgi:hypothetical protein